MNPALRIFFKFISYIFHPLLLPTYGTALFVWANPSITPVPTEEGDIIRTPMHLIISIFVNTFLMPSVAILMMKKLDFIKSLEMEDKQDRIIPFIATMIFYIWAFLAVKDHFSYMPKIFSAFILGTLISVFISFFINLFEKLSIHMVGVSGWMTATMMMMMSSEKSMLMSFIGVIVICGLVATARLYLKAHTVRELYIGFLMGIAGQMIAVVVFSKFFL